LNNLKEKDNLKSAVEIEGCGKDRGIDQGGKQALVRAHRINNS